MALSHPAVKPEFWSVIEDSFPDKEKVQAALQAMDRETLVAFAAHVIVARNSVRHRDTPLVIKEEALSALTLEDLTGWIVSQGQKFTKSAEDASDGLLSRLYRVYLEQSSPDPLGEAFHSYAARFDGDLNDAVDAYLRALTST